LFHSKQSFFDKQKSRPQTTFYRIPSRRPQTAESRLRSGSDAARV